MACTAQAMERCHKLGNGRAMDVFVLELLNLHRGQVRGKHECHARRRQAGRLVDMMMMHDDEESVRH